MRNNQIHQPENLEADIALLVEVALEWQPPWLQLKKGPR